jgi:hypothetical protein
VIAAVVILSPGLILLALTAEGIRHTRPKGRR